MKNLIAGLVAVAMSYGAAHADFQVFVGTQVVSVATSPAVEIPVEQKVVEIHMTSKVPATQGEIRQRGKSSPLPFGWGTCSGEFIDGKGDILTARHCVEGFDSFEVQTADQRRYTATVIATSTVHDLAMIHIDRRNTPFFVLADDVVRGEAVSILGSPLGITDALSTGVIAKLGGDETLVDCSALPGNSGGPVFDKDSKLVGVLTAGHIVLYGTTHLNIAQSLDAVRYFVDEVLEKRYGHR